MGKELVRVAEKSGVDEGDCVGLANGESVTAFVGEVNCVYKGAADGIEEHYVVGAGVRIYWTAQGHF